MSAEKMGQGSETGRRLPAPGEQKDRNHAQE